jgi:hypothetical protein
MLTTRVCGSETSCSGSGFPDSSGPYLRILPYFFFGKIDQIWQVFSKVQVLTIYVLSNVTSVFVIRIRSEFHPCEIQILKLIVKSKYATIGVALNF